MPQPLTGSLAAMRLQARRRLPAIQVQHVSPSMRAPALQRLRLEPARTASAASRQRGALSAFATISSQDASGGDGRLRALFPGQAPGVAEAQASMAARVADAQAAAEAEETTQGEASLHDKELSNAEKTALAFQDASVAFQSKGNLELLRTWLVFQICTIGPVVRHCSMLYDLAERVLGTTVVHFFMRHSFFNHFCAGETAEELKPKMDALRRLGVGGILDYAAEAKDEDLAMPEVPTDEDAVDSLVGAPQSSRMYDYQGEALCDANTEIFMQAIRAVHDSTPEGFAAIKLSGLGNPVLLERMSTCLVQMTRLFKRISEGDLNQSSTEPYFLMDRSFQMEYADFREGWLKLFTLESEDELRAHFDKLDTDRDGLISYLEWSQHMRLSEMNALVRSCRQKGPMYHAALDDTEVELYYKLVGRVQRILDLASELGVRVMVDAEWTDIQPAIDHIVIFLQRKYNVGDQPIVFNTYQTYLKGMVGRVRRDLQRSSREGWRFGAKVVRGAYLVSEREKAERRGVESPVNETYEETEATFHETIDAILSHKAPSGARAEALVATHNRGSIEYTLGRMEELGLGSDAVYFGQLLGMADHLTFTLGAHGYNAYKYVPYGPIGEVVPYLIRRTQENSAILGSEGVQEERRMVGRELRRRLLRF
eukprot:TRINITY_DN19108_c1_g1_i1.p1 TRINITY_DN19108_c1_g1~~TRINITY_DN19108_c1_g1_i1.p1  ORF type:complete len:654 (+),score=172.93 TRINITY_DN19108_c1_g1_i1:112-2073(+)